MKLQCQNIQRACILQNKKKRKRNGELGGGGGVVTVDVNQELKLL